MKRWLASTLMVMMMTLMTLAGAGCSGTDAGSVFSADEVPSPTPPPTTQLVVPLTTLPPASNPTAETSPPTAPLASADAATTPVVFERLLSPEIGIAEVHGFGATTADAVTIDGTATAFASFDDGPEGGFVARVSVPGAGSHTVCIRDTCGVVDTAG